jgi:hypothetical protein
MGSTAERTTRKMFLDLSPIRAVLFALVALLFSSLNAHAQNIMAADARNVKNYGAKGDGVSDDTQAFLDALNQGRDSHPPFFSAAAVYVPPGTYLIKKTLILWRETLLFGEWTDPPTLLLAPDSSDFQNPDDPQPFLVTAGGWKARAYSTDWKTRNDRYNGISNNTFFIFLEDLKVKIGANNPGCDHAILWACAQQTGIRNVAIDGGSASYALEAGLDGGGGVWDGLTITNSVNGVLSSACSEMLVRNCTFNTPVTIGSYYLCCWDFLGCTFNHPKGVTLANRGFVSILDSQFLNRTALNISGPCHLEQIQFADRAAAPANVQANVSSTGLLTQWTSGQVIVDGASVSGSSVSATDTLGLPGTGAAFAYPRPTAACVNIKALGAKGDGASDDTAVIQLALRKYSEIFFPLGTYLVSKPLFVHAGQKLFGQSAGSIIQLAGGGGDFEGGEQAPRVSVQGGGKGVAIVGLWFWNFAERGGCCLWDAGSSSIVMDSQFINLSTSNPEPAWRFRSGGGFIENCWNAGSGAYGLTVNSLDPLWLYSVQEEHYTVTALRIENAANVVGLNVQFETSPTYVSIKNSKSIYLNGVIAGNWNSNSKQLVVIENSKTGLFGLQINRNQSGIVLDRTTSPIRTYGTSDRNGKFVTLDGYVIR